MPVSRAPQVSLADDGQRPLEAIVRAHSTPQALSFRCQLILRAAAADRPSNLQVAKELHCDRHTVGRWRSRYLEHGLKMAFPAVGWFLGRVSACTRRSAGLSP